MSYRKKRSNSDLHPLNLPALSLSFLQGEEQELCFSSIELLGNVKLSGCGDGSQHRHWSQGVRDGTSTLWHCSRHDLSPMHQLRHTHSTSGERQMPIKYFSHSLVQQGKSEGKPVHPSPGFMYLTVSRHVLFVYLHQGSGSGLSWD